MEKTRLVTGRRNELGQFTSAPTAGVVERFMSKVFPEALSGCWNWFGATHSSFGYGSFKWGSRGTKTECSHRVAYKLFKGEIPDGQMVLHSCDNPACVNPDHLRLGNHKDNSADCVSRLRHAFGERHRHSKMTEEQALIAKTTDTPTKVLARLWGCSRQAIADARFGRTWKHVRG